MEINKNVMNGKENVNVKEMENKKLFVVRQEFTTNDGKVYWSYFLKSKIENKEIKVDFVPKDIGGYEVLDILFMFSDKAELLISDESIEIDGKVTEYRAHKLKTTDSDGVEYECEVKPYKSSDKALLQMVINRLNVAKK